jgi:uncharacterized membrane protein YphA (DoxX/SURF4 family)
MKSDHAWAALRIAVGLLLMYSGFCKLLEPAEYYELPLNSYAVLPFWGTSGLATLLPWVELTLGAFLAAGLYIQTAALALLLLVIVDEAILAAAVLTHRGGEFNGVFGGRLASWGARPALLLAFALGLALLKLRFRPRHLYALDNALAHKA